MSVGLRQAWKLAEVLKTYDYSITPAAVAPIGRICLFIRFNHEAEANIHYQHHPPMVAFPLLTEDLADFLDSMEDLH